MDTEALNYVLGDPLKKNCTRSLNQSSALVKSQQIFPRLQMNLFDGSPFSESFSGLFDDEPRTDDSQDQPGCASQEESYMIERFTDMKELDPDWEDEDIDEILVMSPKLSRRLPTITEEMFSEPDVVVQEVAMSDFELLEPTPHLCRKRDTGRLFVLKSFRCRESPEQVILGMLKALEAPFLPEVHWAFRGNDKFHIVMEYYPREKLRGLLDHHGPFPPSLTLFYACEIAEGISALHATGIIHRNLSPDNILIDSDGHIVVTGLENARLVEHSGKVQGLPDVTHRAKECQAPELLLGWAHDFAVDCWGLGLLLHFMLSGNNLFRSDDHQLLQRKVIYDPIILDPLLEPLARDLILKCLERNPAVRICINAMGKHAYFAAVNWENVAAKRVQVPLLSEVQRPVQVPADTRDSNVPARSLSDSCTSRKVSRPASTNVDLCLRPTNAAVAEKATEQALPLIFRVSSLMDDLPTKESISEAEPTPLPMQSVLTLGDLPSDNRIDEVNSRDRMALFWEMLDSERRSVSSSPSLYDPDAEPVRPRKLRKARSSIYPEQQRLSTLSTLSLQNKLPRSWRPHKKAPSTKEISKIPLVHFPKDIEQIGSGIGFTYSLPVASRSKASICSSAPLGCSTMFSRRMSAKGLGLRFGIRQSPSDSKRVALGLATSPTQQGNEDDAIVDFGGSTWSLVLPTLSGGCHTVGDVTATNSPVSDAGPLTPDIAEYQLRVLKNDDSLERKGAQQIKDGNLNSTLRLVSSPRSLVQGEDQFIVV